MSLIVPYIDTPGSIPALLTPVSPQRHQQCYQAEEDSQHRYNLTGYVRDLCTDVLLMWNRVVPHVITHLIRSKTSGTKPWEGAMLCSLAQMPELVLFIPGVTFQAPRIHPAFGP